MPFMEVQFKVSGMRWSFTYRLNPELHPSYTTGDATYQRPQSHRPPAPGNEAGRPFLNWIYRTITVQGHAFFLYRSQCCKAADGSESSGSFTRPAWDLRPKMFGQGRNQARRCIHQAEISILLQPQERGDRSTFAEARRQCPHETSATFDLT